MEQIYTIYPLFDVPVSIDREWHRDDTNFNQ